MQREIALASGQEVLFIADVDQDGKVFRAEAVARGSDVQVLAPPQFTDRGALAIHNHPSGELRPSEADLQVAGRLAELGIGSAIVDNLVERIYVLVEPLPPERPRSMLDADRLADLVRSDGAIAQSMDDFIERAGQVAMLADVARGLNDGALVLAEAGTGVGKSLAYLVPVVSWAAENDERVVVSTATINLQQQILDKDLPLVQRALGTSLPVALVKGRANYLCQRKLAEQLQEPELDTQIDTLQALSDWAEQSDDGSRSDLPFALPEREWSSVASEPDACAIARCPNRERCFVLKARRKAAAARVLVANHHIVFSDLAVRRSGAGWDGTAVLPPFRHVVFDEAHNIERSATSYFSERTGLAALRKHASRVSRERRSRRVGLIHRLEASGVSQEVAGATARAADAVREAADRMNRSLAAVLAEEPSFRLEPASYERFRSLAEPALGEAAQAALDLAAAAARALRGLDDIAREEAIAAELEAIVRRLEAAAAVVERFRGPELDENMVLWLDRGRGEVPLVSLVATPTDLRPIMRESVYDPLATVVLCSATLTVGASFAGLASRLGIDMESERVRTGVYPSPFDYRSRVLLAVPRDAPDPGHARYDEYVATLIERSVGASGGGALALFTSYAQLDRIWQRVAPVLQARGHTVYRQDGSDRARLLDRFKADVSSVLFATDSFWEGIDAPGATLRLVLVVRLPFPVPTDPIQRARGELIERAGGNPFLELSLPTAVTRLKQGFGRLMRRADDRGAVVIADPRLVRKFYGRVFVESLPPAQRIAASGEEIAEALREFFAQD